MAFRRGLRRDARDREPEDRTSRQKNWTGDNPIREGHVIQSSDSEVF